MPFSLGTFHLNRVLLICFLLAFVVPLMASNLTLPLASSGCQDSPPLSAQLSATWRYPPDPYGCSVDGFVGGNYYSCSASDTISSPTVRDKTCSHWFNYSPQPSISVDGLCQHVLSPLWIRIAEHD